MAAPCLRGRVVAIDNKLTVIGILEAVDAARRTLQPARTVHLAFGHDEEVGGLGGARQIAALLRSRGVQLEMIVDEGGLITDGVLPGVVSTGGADRNC